jgi:hypothetical protein
MMIRPRLSSSTPIAPRFKDSVTGRRPIATRTTSTSSLNQLLYRTEVSQLTHGLFLSTLGSVNFDRDLVSLPGGADDFGVELELDTLLGQDLLE